VPSLPSSLPLHIASALLAVTAAVTAQAPSSAPAQGYRETISGTVVGFEMVPVPGGSVTVGGTAVTVDPFLIGRTEVTWDMYDLFAEGGPDVRGNTGSDASTRPSRPYGAPDYGWGHAGYPAISVTRQAAEAFCAWLSARTGKTYRLPTEAEWVRAAELAGKDSTSASREAVTWHRANANATTHPVGARKADALGLFDLFGNAAEWVTTSDGLRITRGGSFRDTLENTGPAARAEQDSSWNERDPQLPKSRWWLSDGPFVGFRLVATGK
jgi:formylglycine-generating enzyme required for sulfatase activity